MIVLPFVLPALNFFSHRKGFSRALWRGRPARAHGQDGRATIRLRLRGAASPDIPEGACFGAAVGLI
jgi:hypothetical protein